MNLGVLYFNLAQAHYGKAPDPRHLDLAEQEYRTAFRIDPKFIPARINLAMFYDALGRKDDAEKLFREITELEPELAEAGSTLGLLLAEDERRMDGPPPRSSAAALSSDNPRIHYYELALQNSAHGGGGRSTEDGPADFGTSQSSLQFLHALAILYAAEALGQGDFLPRESSTSSNAIASGPSANPQWPRLLVLREKGRRFLGAIARLASCCRSAPLLLNEPRSPSFDRLQGLERRGRVQFERASPRAEDARRGRQRLS